HGRCTQRCKPRLDATRQAVRRQAWHHWIETTARAPGSFRPLARSRELSSHRGPKTARVSGERQTSRVPVRGGAAARGEGSPCDPRAFGGEKDHPYPPPWPF